MSTPLALAGTRPQDRRVRYAPVDHDKARPFRRAPMSAKARAEAHPCRACGEHLIAPGYAVCTPCWTLLDSKTRRPLAEAFRARTSNPEAFEMAEGLAVRLCREAREQRRRQAAA